MSENFKSRLKHVSTLIFDIDGVLTDGKLFFMSEGAPVRSLHIKDAYALQAAAKKGYRLVVITYANSELLRDALQRLGIEQVFIKQEDKLKCYLELLTKNSIDERTVLYMGDDLPDIEVMKRVAVAVCPADAAPEIKEISVYVSDKKGGEGCVRDVVEQVMRVRGDWYKG